MKKTHIFILLLIAAGVAITNAAPVPDDQAARVPVSSETEQRISALLGAPDIQSSLEHIRAMESQLHDDLIELTEIPAPPFGEEKRGLRFAEMLREAGLADVTIDEVGNVIGRRPGRSGSKVVAYVAHLDTVFPLETDVTVRVEGDTYYAPGVGDNTRGLVVILGVLRALEQKVWVTFAAPNTCSATAARKLTALSRSMAVTPNASSMQVLARIATA